ncbi:MAG: hypothetical protein LBU51_11395 [Bacteroidales bacterium]|jgi:hypothetical protein|nr:hypothetical protein [Bacteroidales bacterium]
MKKLIFMLIALLAMQTIFSQDLIITKKAEKITAIILEIGETSVKYKKFDNQEGPIYNIKKVDIATIFYQNGSFDVFTDDNIYFQDDYQPVYQDIDLNTLYRSGRNYYMKDAYGNRVQMFHWRHYDKDYEAFLKNNCQEAYDVYKKGIKLTKIGLAFDVIGVPMYIAGLIFTSTETHYNTTYDNIITAPIFVDELYYSGIAFIALSSAMIIASIPLHIVGNHLKRHSSVNTYNDFCSQKPKTSSSLNVSPMGVGYKLKF